MLRNTAEERRSHSQGGGNLKSIREVIFVMLWKKKSNYSNPERRRRKLLHTMALCFGKLADWLAVYPAPDNTLSSRRTKWSGTAHSDPTAHTIKVTVSTSVGGGNWTPDGGKKCHTDSKTSEFSPQGWHPVRGTARFGETCFLHCEYVGNETSMTAYGNVAD